MAGNTQKIFLTLSATQLLLCSLVPNRPETNTSLWAGVWEPWFKQGFLRQCLHKGSKKAAICAPTARGNLLP